MATNNNEKSITNEELLDLYREQHGCSCENHVDIKSFKKWLAEGFAVKKGEKAIRLHAIIEYDRKDGDGNVVKNGKGEAERGAFIKQFKACVFCRCQVEPLKAKEDEPHEK